MRWPALTRYRDDGRLEIDTDVFDKARGAVVAAPQGQARARATS